MTQLELPFGAPLARSAVFPLDRLIPYEGSPEFTQAVGPNGRTIYLPNEAMSHLHEDFVRWLEGLKVKMYHAHGGIPGKSIVTNVQAHLKSRYFYLADIRDAYGTVELESMTDVLLECSYILRSWPREWTRQWLKRWCFLPGGGLITGSPSAPMLFNIYCARRFDSDLSRYGTYTRYLDDIVISTQRPLSQGDRRRIRVCVWRAGFKLADGKTRVGLDLTKGPIKITGVMLEEGGRIFPSKRDRARATGMIAAALSGRVNPAQALGYLGSCCAALPGPPAERRLRPEVARVWSSAERLNAQLITGGLW